MVDAQQARRVLDRLVGYKISPLLWDKVRRGLSAGRVQSVALKLICDREREIERVRRRGVLEHHGAARRPRCRRSSTRKLLKKDGANIKVGNEAEAERGPRRPASRRDWIVSVGHDEGAQEERGAAVHHEQAAAGRALPGQEDDDDRAAALRRHRAAGRRGGRPHHLHANRLDARVGAGADGGPRVHRPDVTAPDYVPEKPNVYKTKADAQDAHEAIRPTSMQYHPETVRAHLTPDQYYLYKLDLEPLRRVADAAGDLRRDDGRHQRRGDYLFRVKGSVPKFAGWMAVYNQEDAAVEQRTRRAGARRGHGGGRRRDAACCRRSREGDRLELKELKPEQKFTQPPPRYTEATLVKALEENGIGRPSTYASIISVIQARDYVNKIEGRFKPTVLGMMLVEKLLSPAFDDILDVEYTRELEEDLDKIEEGKDELRVDARRASTRSSRRT